MAKGLPRVEIGSLNYQQTILTSMMLVPRIQESIPVKGIVDQNPHQSERNIAMGL